ncbi:MAG TPA: GNAT family N-acetyltransferase [Candidatus Competibacteraceae bacterium]|nr:GNAT family N-acetyltransferase [Candidatus Competibacteraceae bacterium]
MIPTSLLIRPYREADFPALVAVVEAAFAEYWGRSAPSAGAEHKTHDIVRAELSEAAALVAERKGALVGCVFYRPHGDAVYLDRLAVVPGHRRRGIASALVGAVEHSAQEQGYARLILSVRLLLEHQQRFFRRLGFEFAAYGSHEGSNEPAYMKMVKTIAQPVPPHSTG